MRIHSIARSGQTKQALQPDSLSRRLRKNRHVTLRHHASHLLLAPMLPNMGNIAQSFIKNGKEMLIYGSSYALHRTAE